MKAAELDEGDHAKAQRHKELTPGLGFLRWIREKGAYRFATAIAAIGGGTIGDADESAEAMGNSSRRLSR